ncbi:MAG: TRAP transporter substrate-binding protein [Salinisphaeraceae bacterium]
MKRRDLMLALGAGGLASACGRANDTGSAPAREAITWNMVTTWPKNFPGLGTAAQHLADLITRMSDGELTVRVYGAGERVPALEVFDAVSRGAAQMGHGAAYYWKGKSPATPFFTAVPFGMTASEMQAWLHVGGGMELWRELYAEFDLVPFEAGDTGTQMGGWFREPVADLEALRQLKVRMPGLGGEVLQALDVTTVNIPGSELFTSLQQGVIDAAEWVGPYNDLAFGFHKVARHYYYPGWHEPCGNLEAIVHKPAWAALPERLQAVVGAACMAAGRRMQAEMRANNQRALRSLVDEHGVTLHRFPDDILAALREATPGVLEDLVAGDAFASRVHDAYRDFAARARDWTTLGEAAILELRP